MTTHDSTSNNRRSFLKGAATLGAAATLGGAARAQQEPSANRRLRVGIIGAGEYSFTSFSWSDVIEGLSPANSRRGNFGTQLLNMDITHVWDAKPDTVTDFVTRMDAELVDKYDDMVGKVDGIIMGGFYEVPWQHKLARPYIEAGIPCYISRPFALSLRDIDELLDLCAKHGTPILATAKHEHYNEVPALKSKLPNVGRINCVHATCWSNDFPIHLHTQFMLPHIFGFDIREMALYTDDFYRNTYLQETYLFNGWEDQPAFPCALHGAPNQDSFTITVIGTTGIEHVRMERSPHWRDSLLYRFAPQVIAMQRTFEGEMFEPLDNIRKKTEMFLTAAYSSLERNGAPVKMGTLPVDWRMPAYRPDWLDESMFSG